MPDLVSEAMTTLTRPELQVMAKNAGREAAKLKETEPAWSLVWSALALSAESALVERRAPKIS